MEHDKTAVCLLDQDLAEREWSSGRGLEQFVDEGRHTSQPRKLSGFLAGETPACPTDKMSVPRILMQAMGDQTTCALQKLLIFLAKGVQFVALGIQHAEDVPVLISHWDNNL